VFIIKEYDRILLKDGRVGTVVSDTPDGPYFVDVGDSVDTWDNILVEQNQIEKVLQ